MAESGVLDDCRSCGLNPERTRTVTNAEYAHLLVVLYIHEEWRPAVGFGGYEVSTHARVKGRRGWILKPSPQGSDPHRRFGVILQREGDRVSRHIHRLVLEAFRGPCPDGMEGCHGDGDPANNHLWNLRWDTKSNNMADRRRHGNECIPKGENHGMAKLRKSDVLEIRRLSAKGHMGKSIAKRFRVTPTTVSRVIRRQCWKDI